MSIFSCLIDVFYIYICSFKGLFIDGAKSHNRMIWIKIVLNVVG